ncbi:MAG: iron ABC transporter substrate-binding protein [Magnetovibrionaceae bacterium]
MMLRLLALVSIILIATTPVRAEPGFTDDAGRSVPVEGIPERVFAAGHPASILLYALAPDLLTGWSRRLPDQARPFLLPSVIDLPVLGRLAGRGGTANVEVVLKADPDLVIDYGSVRPTFISLADRVQDQTGLPVALLDGSLDEIPETFRKLGAFLHRQDRASLLADKAEELLARIDRIVAAEPAENRPRVYYGRGGTGLETGRRGSINVEMLNRLGAVNVAAATGDGGLARISLEQVVTWDPDLIITIDPNFYADIFENPQWAGLRAVREGRVYLAPDLPFGWFDRPPSINRLIGLEWLVHLLYPDRAEGDLVEIARTFMATFYHVDPGREAVARLLDRRDGS